MPGLLLTGRRALYWKDCANESEVGRRKQFYILRSRLRRLAFVLLRLSRIDRRDGKIAVADAKPAGPQGSRKSSRCRCLRCLFSLWHGLRRHIVHRLVLWRVGAICNSFSALGVARGMRVCPLRAFCRRRSHSMRAQRGGKHAAPAAEGERAKRNADKKVSKASHKIEVA